MATGYETISKTIEDYVAEYEVVSCLVFLPESWTGMSERFPAMVESGGEP